MKLTKEEYENLINGSPLFNCDKDCDRALYKTYYYKLINYLTDYCTAYIYPLKQRLEGTAGAGEYNRQADAYNAIICETLMETAVECIKRYDKGRGEFLNLFNSLMKRNLAIAKAKEVEDRYRCGIKLSEDEGVLIGKITRYVKRKGLDINSPDVQVKIAEALRITPERVAELIRINDDAVAISSTVKNEEGDEVELFDAKQSEEASADRDAEQLSLLEFKLKDIQEKFDSLQNRPKQRRLLSMLLTAKFIEEFDGERRYAALIKGLSFYSKEIEEIYLKQKRVPLDYEIAEICSVSPQQASNTYKEFLKKFK